MRLLIRSFIALIFISSFAVKSISQEKTECINVAAAVLTDGSYLRSSGGTMLDFSKSSFTLDFWTQIEKPGIILSKGNPCAMEEPSFSIEISEDYEIIVNVFDGDRGLQLKNEKEPIDPDNYNHIALIYSAENATIRLMLNGTLASESDFGGILSAGQPVSFGQGCDKQFQGLFDEFRVWNTAKTEAQINAAMNVRPGGDEPDLLAYFSFDENLENAVKNQNYAIQPIEEPQFESGKLVDLQCTQPSVITASIKGESLPSAVGTYYDIGTTTVGENILFQIDFENTSSNSPYQLTSIENEPPFGPDPKQQINTNLPPQGILSVPFVMNGNNEGTFQRTQTFVFTNQEIQEEIVVTVNLEGSAEEDEVLLPDMNVAIEGNVVSNNSLYTLSDPSLVDDNKIFPLFINNSGEANLNIQSVTTSGDLIFDNYSGSLAPDENTTLNVRLNTSTSGFKSGTITIISNDPDEPTFRVTIGSTVNTPPVTWEVEEIYQHEAIEIYRGLSGVVLRSFSVTNTSDVDSELSSLRNMVFIDNAQDFTNYYISTAPINNPANATVIADQLLLAANGSYTPIEQTIAAGQTLYFFCMVDVSTSATYGNSIQNGSPLVEDFEFDEGTIEVYDDKNRNPVKLTIMPPRIQITDPKGNVMAPRTQRVDLGAYQLNDEVTFTFNITNIGPEELLADLSIDVGDFFFGNVGRVGLDKNENIQINIDAATSIPGVHTDTLRFRTNDPARPEFAYALRITVASGAEASVYFEGISNELDVEQAVSFDSVFQNTVVTKELTIKNDGDTDLSLAYSLNGTTITPVEPLSDKTLSPDEGDVINFQVDASSIGQKSVVLNIATNDDDEPNYEIQINANVVEPFLVASEYDIPSFFEVTVDQEIRLISFSLNNPTPTDIIFESLNLDITGSDIENDLEQVRLYSSLTSDFQDSILVGTTNATINGTVFNGLGITTSANETLYFKVITKISETPSPQGYFEFSNLVEESFGTNLGYVDVNSANYLYAYITRPYLDIEDENNNYLSQPIDTIDLGTVTQNQSLESKLYFYNYAYVPLEATISSSNVSLSKSSFVIDPNATSMNNDSVSFSVPTNQIGIFRDTIVINSNAEDPIRKVYVEAEVVGLPEARLSNTEVNEIPTSRFQLRFDTTFKNSGSEQLLTLSNIGTAPLNVSGYSTNGDFYVTGGGRQILAPGESFTISILMDSVTIGEKSGTLTINTSDSNEETYTIQLMGYVKCNPSTYNPIIAAQNSNLCEGEPTSIQWTNSQPSQLNYSWSKNNIPISNAQTLQINGNRLDQGTYRLTLSDEDDCSYTSNSISIAVNSVPTANIDVDFNDVYFCETVPNKLTLDTVYDNTSYRWLLNGQMPISNSSSLTFNGTANESGSYQAVLTSDEGCEYTTSAVRVYIEPLPIYDLNFEGDSTIFIDSSIDLWALGIGYSGETQWYRNGNEVRPGQYGDTLLSISEAGRYSARFTSESGCVYFSDTVRIRILGQPELDVQLNGNYLLPNQLISFDSTLENTVASISLLVENNGTAPLTIIAEATGNFTITNTPAATLASGNSTTVRLEMNTTSVGDRTGFLRIISNDPDEDTTLFDLQGFVKELCYSNYTPQIGTNNDYLCEGDFTIITLQNIPPWTANYTWHKEGISISSTTSSTVIDGELADSGNYYLSITDSNSCVYESDTVFISVNAKPIAELNITSDTTIIAGDSILLIAQNSDIYGFNWLYNGFSIQKFSDSIFVSDSGYYSAVFYASNDCSAQSNPILIDTTYPAPPTAPTNIEFNFSNSAPSISWKRSDNDLYFGSYVLHRITTDGTELKTVNGIGDTVFTMTEYTAGIAIDMFIFETDKYDRKSDTTYFTLPYLNLDVDNAYKQGQRIYPRIISSNVSTTDSIYMLASPPNSDFPFSDTIGRGVLGSFVAAVPLDYDVLDGYDVKLISGNLESNNDVFNVLEADPIEVTSLVQGDSLVISWTPFPSDSLEAYLVFGSVDQLTALTIAGTEDTTITIPLPSNYEYVGIAPQFSLDTGEVYWTEILRLNAEPKESLICQNDSLDLEFDTKLGAPYQVQFIDTANGEIYSAGSVTDTTIQLATVGLPTSTYLVRVSSGESFAISQNTFTINAIQDASIAITGPSNICSNVIADYYATATNPSDPPLYVWYVDDVLQLLSASDSFSFNPASDTTVLKVIMTSSAPCLTNASISDSVIIVEKQSPISEENILNISENLISEFVRTIVLDTANFDRIEIENASLLNYGTASVESNNIKYTAATNGSVNGDSVRTDTILFTAYDDCGISYEGTVLINIFDEEVSTGTEYESIRDTITIRVSGNNLIYRYPLADINGLENITALSVINVDRPGVKVSVDGSDLVIEFEEQIVENTEIQFSTCSSSGNVSSCRDVTVEAIFDNTRTGIVYTDSTSLSIDIFVYNALSPDLEDGIGDYLDFSLSVTESHTNGDPSTKTLYSSSEEVIKDVFLEVYNKWGDKVYEKQGYATEEDYWYGYDENNEKLPAGTYYYYIKMVFFDSEGNTHDVEKTGYLELRR